MMPPTSLITALYALASLDLSAISRADAVGLNVILKTDDRSKQQSVPTLTHAIT